MSLLSTMADYRKARSAARTVRKLRGLRHRVSPGGYTLASFDQHRCIFIHIPKCAGVSVCRSLFGNYGAGHYPVTTFQQVFDPDSFDRYFKFAFVRNPWDRLLSAWRFLRAGGFNDTDRRWAQRHLSDYRDFGDFVRHWLTPDHAASWVHFKPQTDFLRLADGHCGVDFVGRYECIERDFGHVCRRLGSEARLMRLNQGAADSKDYRDAYDSETRAIVADVYAQDIAGLGYDFDSKGMRPERSADR